MGSSTISSGTMKRFPRCERPYCPCYVSEPGNISVALLSVEGQRALRFYQKYLNLCSEDEQMSYGFGIT